MSLRSVFLATLVLAGTLPALAQPALNTLTKAEKKAGWKLLWDGKTTAGWESRLGGPFPTVGWEIKDGLLSVTETNTKEGGDGGDIITTRKYANYELSVDYRISKGANTGILYLVNLDLKKGPESPAGYEYQMLDDTAPEYAKNGKGGNRMTASLYDMIAPAANKPMRAIGEWNTARIVVNGTHVEHWLNGMKVVEYDRSTPEFRQLVAESKFKKYPGFAEMYDTQIVLQDHGFPVSFRNIKIRELPPTPAK
jgi:hypothetical protein